MAVAENSAPSRSLTPASMPGSDNLTWLKALAAFVSCSYLISAWGRTASKAAQQEQTCMQFGGADRHQTPVKMKRCK